MKYKPESQGIVIKMIEAHLTEEGSSPHMKEVATIIEVTMICIESDAMGIMNETMDIRIEEIEALVIDTSAVIHTEVNPCSEETTNERETMLHLK